MSHKTVFSDQQGGRLSVALPHTAPEETIILKAQKILIMSDFWKIISSFVLPRKLLLTVDPCSH